MTDKTSCLPGEPIWADLASPDPPRSAAFYGALLGWTATPPQPELGGYASFLLRGHKVAGLMPLMAADQAPTWTSYLCSDDADKTAALVEQAGGTTLAGPMDVADLGRMAVFADPAGAVFGVWQPGTHTGAELAAEDGTQTWLELTADKPADAPGFYGAVFGWAVAGTDNYVEFTLSGTSVAGCTDLSQCTVGWLPYFEVADPGEKAEQVQSLGGSVVLPLTSFDGGSCAIVRDPDGATFGLRHTG